jgi:excisionase family DNA binding protein
MSALEQTHRPLTTLMTRTEVAALMQVSDRTIDRWHNEGRLRRIRVARAVRFRAEDVAEFIAAAADEEPDSAA